MQKFFKIWNIINIKQIQFTKYYKYKINICQYAKYLKLKFKN